jgi:RNA polymerase sigma factor (sigma-70 family)
VGVRLADDRHDFVLGHAGLAYQLTRALADRLRPGRWQADEVRSLAYLAAVDAAARWDEGRGLKFGAYLKHYVRKHVMIAVYGDSLLHVDHTYLTHLPLRGGTPEQDARRAERVAQAARGWVGVSLDAPDPDTGRTRAGQVPDRDRGGSDDVLDLRERLDRLEPRDAEVLLRHYGHLQKLEDVGRSLGVTKQRASQLRRRAMARIREMYGVDPAEARRAM